MLMVSSRSPDPRLAVSLKKHPLEPPPRGPGILDLEKLPKSPLGEVPELGWILGIQKRSLDWLGKLQESQMTGDSRHRLIEEPSERLLAPQSPELQLVGVEDRPLHGRNPPEMRLVLLPDLLPDRLKVVEDLGLGVEDELPVTAVDSLETGSQSTEDAGPGGRCKVLRRTTRYGPHSKDRTGTPP